MKLIQDGQVIATRSVWYDSEKNYVKLLDQTKLPYSTEVYTCKNIEETCKAIKTMIVRGAPAIGATAALGMVQAARASMEQGSISPTLFAKNLEQAANKLIATRPTARDLRNFVERVLVYSEQHDDLEIRVKNIEKTAIKLIEDLVKECQSIGEQGQFLIKDGMGILTHCNAGPIACVDWGTALAGPIKAHRDGIKFKVFIDETRPRLQGAKLTAWELLNEGIEHYIISDNAAYHFMQRGEIDLVIVGADRIAMNGDFANKIGTLGKAIAAKEFGIPFYSAAPFTTFDQTCESGDQIKIEERRPEEVAGAWGLNTAEMMEFVRFVPKKSTSFCRNPAFDVTPAEFVTGFITSQEIVTPENVKKLF
ncbi:MAG: S-methyl-5-thioribose-1-phosphate isomerase [Promethearchaeota archaeon]